jgi:RNA-directed DNA polymerase
LPLDGFRAAPRWRHPRPFAVVASASEKKTAGVDGQTRWRVEQQGVEKVLGELRQSLKDGSYAPLPVREHQIPKRGSGKVRSLGIPALRDRIVTHCVSRLGQAPADS